MRIVAGACLKSRSVSSAIPHRHCDKPDQLACGGQPGDPARCLAALVDDDVDPEPGETTGETADVGQDRALEPGAGAVPAEGRNKHQPAIIVSHQPAVR